MKVLVVHIWVFLLVLNQRNRNMASAQCAGPPVLCCAGVHNRCSRGCYCDEACLSFNDCCPDHQQTCIQSANAQPSSPSLATTTPDSPTLSSSSSSLPDTSSSSLPDTSSSSSSLPDTSASSSSLPDTSHSSSSLPDTSASSLPDTSSSSSSLPDTSHSSSSLPDTSSLGSSLPVTSASSSSLPDTSHSTSSLPDTSSSSLLDTSSSSSSLPDTSSSSSSLPDTSSSSLPDTSHSTSSLPDTSPSSSSLPDTTSSSSSLPDTSSSSSSLPVTLSSQTSAPSSSSQSTTCPTSSSSIASLTAYSQPSSPSLETLPPSTWTTRHSPTLSSSSSSWPDTSFSSSSWPNTSSSSSSLPDTSSSSSSWPDTSSSSSSLPVTLSSHTSAPSSSLQSTISPTSSSIPSLSVCSTCTENETCQKRGGVYGCCCLQGQRPHPENFDAVESCASSTGSISLSRCQLFESGFYPEHLHLNDPNCTGTLEDGRLVFYFDNKGHVCGTTLMSNRTHFIYQNSIQSNPTDTDNRIISRQIWMNMTFSCAYPLIQTISMPVAIQAEGGVISEELPAGQGTYQIRMIPYHDAEFTSPYDGEVQIQVNQRIYVAVEVEGVDRNQIATVLDKCWATPVNDAEYHVHWNLIINECANPEDATVEVLQNGFDTTSRFSFRMFTFSGISDHVFLHCQVHLCLVQNGRCALLCDRGYRSRRHRSLDFLHSTAISMSLKAQ